VCLHVWVVFFYYVEFSLQWSCGDLTVKKVPICLNAWGALATTYRLPIFKLFCFVFIVYRMQMLKLCGFLTFCHCMWARNQIFFMYLLLALCFHDLHWFGDQSFPSFPRLKSRYVFQLFLRTLPTHQLTRDITLQWVESLMTGIPFPHNVIRWSFLASCNVPCRM
jgi:hypothetical protein